MHSPIRSAYLTHDIDWLDPWHPYSIVKWLIQGKRWLRLNQLIHRDLYLEQIKKLIALEEELGVKSIFLLAASAKSLGLHDVRYTTSSKQFHRLIALLAGQEIGLHSVGSSDPGMQLEALKAFVQKPIRYHRSHFFRLDKQQLYPLLDSKGIQTDFSAGEARNVRFSSPGAGAGNLHLVPTVLSDNAFFFHRPEAVFAAFEKSLEDAAQQHADIAILWHPENTLLLPALWEHYRRVIDLCKKHQYTFIV